MAGEQVSRITQETRRAVQDARRNAREALDGHVVDTTAAHHATAIAVTPVGLQINDEVQAAIDFLVGEVFGRIEDGDISAILAALNSWTSGDPTLTNGAVLEASLIAAQHLAVGSVIAGKLSANAVVAGNIDANVITGREINADAINATHISAASIDATHIGADVVNATHLEAGSVDAAAIAAGVVDATHIAADAINAGHISADSIDATHIAAGAITTAALATDAVQSINYAYTAGNHSDVGTKLDLANGVLTGVKFAIDVNGDVYAVGISIADAPTAPSDATRKDYVDAGDAAATSAINDHLADTVDAHDSSAISHVGVGLLLGFDDVQSAIDQTMAVAADFRDGDVDKIIAMLNAWTAPDGQVTGVDFLADNIMSDTVVTRIMAAGAIAAGKLSANAVTAGNIDANVITTRELAVDSVEAANVKAGEITAGKLSANSVSTANLQALAITTDKLAVGAVTADKVGAGAVTADKVAAGAITTEHLQVRPGTLILNGDFADTAYGSGRSWLTRNGANSTIAASASAKVGTNILKLPSGAGSASSVYSRYVPVVAGQPYLVSAWVYSQGTTGNWYGGIYGGNTVHAEGSVRQAGSLETIYGLASNAPVTEINSGWTYKEFVYTPINGVNVMSVTFLNYNTPNGELWVDNVRVVPQVGSTSIQNNAITTGKILANAITTGRLATDAIKSTNYDGPDVGEVFADAGTFLDLANGNITSTGLVLDGTTGDVNVKGDIEATSFTALDSGGIERVEIVTDDTYAAAEHHGLTFLNSTGTRFANMRFPDAAGYLQLDAIDPIPSGPFSVLKIAYGTITVDTSNRNVGTIELVPTNWFTLTLSASWVAHGGGWSAPATRKNGDVVELRGSMKDGTTTDGTLLFTLAAGSRPPATQAFVVDGGTGPVRIIIDTAGAVKIYQTGGHSISSTRLSLDGISFSVTA